MFRNALICRNFRGIDFSLFYRKYFFVPGAYSNILMTVEDIQSICRKHHGVTEDIKWEDHLCFSVGRKIFLITAPDRVPCSASVKVSEEAFDEISGMEGFMPAPYLARYKWVRMDDISRLSRKQWEEYIDTAYHLVASRLPLKVKRQIGLQTNLPIASGKKRNPKQ